MFINQDTLTREDLNSVYELLKEQVKYQQNSNFLGDDWITTVVDEVAIGLCWHKFSVNNHKKFGVPCFSFELCGYLLTVYLFDNKIQVWISDVAVGHLIVEIA